MLDIKFIRENIKLVEENNRNRKADVNLHQLLELDDQRKKMRSDVETLRSERKKNSKIKPTEAEILKMRKVGDKITALENDIGRIEQELNALLQKIPNISHESTPVGPDESGNVVLRQVGERTKLSFKPKEHWELGKSLNLIDNERAANISGARFTFIKGKLAILQFALIQLAFSLLTDQKRLAKIIKKSNLDVKPTEFIPIIPPVMVKPEVFGKMARLEPKDERYYIPSDDLYLIGSAEHTLGPLHMDEILNEKDLPIRYAGYSTAFRREAGSYGKDMKGILRVHQFDKLELESFCLPENSIREQDFFVAIQEELVKSLGLPYQVVQICTGDMGDPDARQIDIEIWMPGQNKYRETHTSDLMTDYQSRRLKTRVRRGNGEVQFVHMNDATAFAIGRTLIAIMENYQQEDGHIEIPKVLRTYTGFKKI